LPAGSFFVMSPGMQHYVYADEETVVHSRRHPIRIRGTWSEKDRE
jgi:hypothetical protein